MSCAKQMTLLGNAQARVHRAACTPEKVCTDLHSLLSFMYSDLSGTKRRRRPLCFEAINAVLSVAMSIRFPRVSICTFLCLWLSAHQSVRASRAADGYVALTADEEAADISVQILKNSNERCGVRRGDWVTASLTVYGWFISLLFAFCIVYFTTLPSSPWCTLAGGPSRGDIRVSLLLCSFPTLEACV